MYWIFRPQKEQQEAMEHFVNFVSLPTGYVITMLLSLEPESLYECIQSCMIFVIFLFQVQQAALLFASACSLPWWWTRCRISSYTHVHLICWNESDRDIWIRGCWLGPGLLDTEWLALDIDRAKLLFWGPPPAEWTVLSGVLLDPIAFWATERANHKRYLLYILYTFF